MISRGRGQWKGMSSNMWTKLMLSVLMSIIKLENTWGKSCFEANNQTFPHLNCSVTATCMDNWLRRGDNENPGPPSKLSVTVIFQNHTNKKSYPGLDIRWQAADDVSFKYTEGFRMRVRYMIGNYKGHKVCRIFNIDRNGWTLEDHLKKPTFYFKVWPLPRGNNLMFVDTCSLPEPEDDNISKPCVTTFVYVPEQWYSRDPNIPMAAADWTTFIQLNNDSCGKLDVDFHLAPSSYGFKLYKVSLIANDSLIASRDVFAPIHTVPFEDVPSGKYFVRVQPRDLEADRQHPQRCVCKDEQGDCRNNCVITQTALDVTVHGCPVTTESASFTTVDGITVMRVLTPENKAMWNSATIVAASTFGGLLGILLIILFVVCSRRSGRARPIFKLVSCYYGDSGQATINNSNNQGTLNGTFALKKPCDNKVLETQSVNNKAYVVEDDLLTSKKKVLILFSEEHPKHTKVVLSFANFLQAACYCDVILDRWCSHEVFSAGKTTWLSKNIECADCILVVSSEGACRRFNAQLEGKYYEALENTSPLSDMFTHGLSMLRQRYFTEHDYSKYINVRFNYTPAEFSLPDMHNNIVLMNHIDDLFFHIHGIEKYDRGIKRTVEGITRDEYFTDPSGNPEGVSLYNAIQEATDFFNDHNNWLSEQCLELTPRRSSARYDRLDSGFDSLSMEEDGEPPWLPESDVHVCCSGNNRDRDNVFFSNASPQSPKTHPTTCNGVYHARPPLAGSTAPTKNTSKYTTDNNASLPVSIPFHSTKCDYIPLTNKQKARPRVTIPCQHFQKLVPPDLNDPSKTGPTLMFIPPVLEDNQSMTFSQIARDINAQCEDDFITYVEDNDSKFNEEINTPHYDCISLQSIGGASL